MAQHPSETDAVRKGILPPLIRRFMQTEAASGMVMIAFALLAIIAINSPLGSWYTSFVGTPVTFAYGDAVATEPLKAWVKDILMVFFFLLIALELKREMCEGFLSQRDQIMLPLLAAIGGMAVPAAIYTACNYATPETLGGWAIPSATDIAFALAILTLFGKKVPPAVKIFLLAIAIFDDLGAIVIIAVFYNTGLALMPLVLAALGILVLAALNRARITTCASYMLVGVFLWFCFHAAGIHTTLAGVAVGLAIPMRNARDPHHSPLNSCMHFLHPWVSFFILPVFAFTSAGVDLRSLTPASLLSPVPLGIALGLFIGKQVGIFGTSWLLIRSKLARMPEAAGWGHLYAVSLLAGIGFTMSLFIGILAFPDAQMQDMVKLGVIGGSLLSILLGVAVLKRTAP